MICCEEPHNEMDGLPYFYSFWNYMRGIIACVLGLSVAGMVEPSEKKRYLEILTFD